MDVKTTQEENRIPPAPGHVLDRGRRIRFTFDGHEYDAYEGDTIASALWANGQRVLSRSFKYHRPRGLTCASGDCPNCLVQVGDQPNVRACRRPVEAGMRVASQNRWPSLSLDMMRMVELADRFLPPGFYYKTFMRPKALWPVYEAVLRRAAGLGRVKAEAEPRQFPKSYLHTDVAVIGGGPAGLQSALAAASCGAEVLLIEEEAFLGGHLRYRGTGSGDDSRSQRMQELVDAVQAETRIRTLMNSNAFGAYDHGWIGAADDQRLYKIRTGAMIAATGTYDLPLLFPNNDLPGILLSGAAQRLVKLWAVRPGQRAVVVAPGRHGWRTALDLLEAGTDVAVLAVPEKVPEPAAALLRDRGVRLMMHASVVKAEGRDQLEAVWLKTGDDTQPIRVPCDLLVASAGVSPSNGLLLQAGAKFKWDATLNRHVPDTLPETVFAAGEVTGAVLLDEIAAQGERVGMEAALQLGFERNDRRERAAGLEAQTAPDSAREAAGNAKPDLELDHEKRFVCFCEDVTRADLRLTIHEGYDSAELLKRYSTVSMGPCQGRMCNYAALHIGAHDNNRSVTETATTTARPPVRPVRLATLAGRPMDPVRLTPMDEWHRDQGAKMMVAGAWMRPEHYGDPLSEVKAVRERVGLIDVSTLGKFHLHGPDVPELLERVYTNRWRKLDVGRVRYGVMVNEEGVVMDDGVTAHVDEDFYYMSATSSGASAVYEWCQWWLQSGWDLDLHMVDATELRAAMNLTGPFARRILRKVTSGVDLSNEAFPYMNVRRAEVAGAPALLLRIGFTGELGYEIHTPSHYGLQVWQGLMEAGAEYDIAPFGIEAQRVLRLEKGHLIVGQDTDSLSDAFEAGMGWAVKFDKDDFLGRPALKHTNERGPTRKLVGFEMPDGSLPEEADQIVRRGDGPIGLEIIGRVTSVRWSPTLD
ncbi:MAG: 2Fe-2S iron-sulfur cluster-binding protein, partial [Anaerolineales bacterium]|nr:2Fe-2S iron-sulfur cluster-binding protein [Anaerolineales bacterium]